MDRKLGELIVTLNNSISDKNFIDISYEVIDEIGGRADAFDAVDSILKLMENNPEVDFGKPGPLVHFVETFYQKGYEEKLVESIKRRPTKHTVWMLNRIINGAEDNEKKHFLSILDNVLKTPNLDKDVIQLAGQFRSLHY